MRRTLVRVGGGLNALFVLLHVWMGWRLHVVAGIDPAIRPLLETFNAVVAVELTFLAYVSLAWPAELLATRVGRAVIGLALATYLGRTLCELIFVPRVGLVIVTACLLVSAVYAAALLLREAPVPATEEATDREMQLR